MSNKIEIRISGDAGAGKSTVATLIQRYLKTLGFNVTIRLTNFEMPPCPTDLRKKTMAILDKGTRMHIEESQEVSDQPHTFVDNDE